MKKLQIAILVILLLVTAALLVLQSDWGKGFAQKSLTDALKESGYKVEIGSFEGTLPHAVDFKNVKIESDTLTISIDSLQTRLSLLALLQNELLFTDLKASGITYQIQPGATPSFGQG